MERFAKGGRAGCKPFEIKVPREHTERMAKGGLASQAKNVANAGVGGDTMVIHINRGEYDQLCKEWGEPTVNPHTGMPQFTPFWKQSWFAPVAAIAGSLAMATGLGAPVGAALLGEGLAGTTLAGATGVGALGGTTLGTLAGNAALGAGVGALTGGGKGALTGGLLAGAGTVGASALGNYLNPAAATGELEGAAGSSSFDKAFDSAASVGSPQASGASSPLIEQGASKASSLLASSPASSGIMDSIKGYVTDPGKMAAAAVMLGGGSGGSEAPAIDMPATTPTTTDPNLTKRLPTAPLSRTRLAGPIDYYNYGSRPEQLYYAPETQPAVQAAEGGPLSRYVQGGGTGRSDSIPAQLSDGEYVFDATTVSLLGDGSSKAGARKLDQMRKNLWKQKGKGMAKGSFGPDAKNPEDYLS